MSSMLHGWSLARSSISISIRPIRPEVLDLTGGEPSLSTGMGTLDDAGIREPRLETKVYLWSDDNLSNDYFWDVLSDADRDQIVWAIRPMVEWVVSKDSIGIVRV